MAGIWTIQAAVFFNYHYLLFPAANSVNNCL